MGLEEQIDGYTLQMLAQGPSQSLWKWYFVGLSLWVLWYNTVYMYGINHVFFETLKLNSFKLVDNEFQFRCLLIAFGCSFASTKIKLCIHLQVTFCLWSGYKLYSCLCNTSKILVQQKRTGKVKKLLSYIEILSTTLLTTIKSRKTFSI